MKEVVVRLATGEGKSVDAERVAQARWTREFVSVTYTLELEVDGVADLVEIPGLTRNQAGQMLTDLGYPALAKTVYADDWTPSRREYLGYWSDKGPK